MSKSFKEKFIILVLAGSFVFVNYVCGFELIEDPHFQQGLIVMDPCRTNGLLEEGRIFYDTNQTSCAWSLAQWNSHGSIWGVDPVQMASGSTKWANIYKSVFMGPVTNEDSDVRLTINSISEFDGLYRTGDVVDWPCLYVQQSICAPGKGWLEDEEGLWVSDLTELDFNMDIRLAAENNIQTNGYNPLLHRTHFRLNFSIMNLGRDSNNAKIAGYGDYYHFSINMYDEWDDYPEFAGIRLDNAGSLKGIYNVGLSPFSTNGLVEGECKNLSGDILPLVKSGLQACWNQGYLTNDLAYMNEEDRYAFYKVNSVNIGWEATGLSCDSIQMKNFSLQAYGRYHPRPYEFAVDGDREGWTSAHLTELHDGPFSGRWFFSATADNPFLVSPSICVDAGTFKKVEVRMLNENDTVDEDVVLFWLCDNQTTTTGACSESLPLQDGSFVYEFDMTNNTNWCGDITGLRLDPLRSGDGEDLTIYYIRFEE